MHDTNQQPQQEVALSHAPRRKLQKLSFMDDDKYFQTAVLGSLGFSYKAIAAATGLNHGEIYYRLKLRKVKLRAYRDGESVFSKMVLARTERMVAKQLAQQLEP